MKKWLIRLLAVVNVLLLAMLLLVGYSGHISPVDHPLVGLAHLVFPLVLIANLAFLLIWVIVKPRMLLLPLLGLVACYVPIRTYCPLNVQSSPPEGAVKVLSFNVFMFNPWSAPKDAPNPILTYLRESNADILCLQESNAWELGEQVVKKELGDYYPYCDTTLRSKGGDKLSLYSRFPILGKERIAYKSRGNQSVACWLNIHGDSVLVVNNHLETMGFTWAEKEKIQNLSKGKGNSKTEQLVLKKLKKASRIRARQADAIAQYIRDSHAKNVIVCGDFNDSPLSYTHHTIASGLRDCYAESGNGPGFTYEQSGIKVRIDNIFCSKNWDVYGCEVDRKITLSDHYPIYCWLKKR